VQGAAAEIGARLGLASIFAFELGFIPNNSLMVVGFQFTRFAGIPLMKAPRYMLSLLAPTIEIKAATDFDKNVFFLGDIGPLGLGFASCEPLPFFIQIRPQFAGWLPYRAAAKEYDSELSHSSVQFSGGVSLEAGLLFF
jgi:hypothetical protein